jgi:hypothetical protein
MARHISAHDYIALYIRIARKTSEKKWHVIEYDWSDGIS